MKRLALVTALALGLAALADVSQAQDKAKFTISEVMLKGHKSGLCGKVVSGKASEAEKHLASALKLTPDSPIAQLEYGNLLLLLHGDKKEDAAAEAYEKASQLKPRDAMEKLDAELARSLIE